MPRYSGLTIVDEAFTATSRTAVVDAIATHLGTAGWTTVSGSSGDWLLQSVATARGYQMRVRLWDPGSNSARIGIRNTGGDIVLEDYPIRIYPESDDFQILATSYQAFVYKPGSVNVGRKFAFFGCPYMDDLTGIDTNVAYAHGNSNNDEDATLRPSFRTAPYTSGAVSMNIQNSTGWRGDFGGNQQGGPQIWGRAPLSGSVIAVPQKSNGDRIVVTPQISFGDTVWSDPGEIRGDLWDMILVSGVFGDGAEIVWDEKLWRAVGLINASFNHTLFHLLPEAPP